MSERKEGWYWVMTSIEWTVAEWGGLFWLDPSYACGDESDCHWIEIGPRVPSPDEPWVTVPVEPTQAMKQAADYDTPGPMTAWKCWQVMIAAATKP